MNKWMLLVGLFSSVSLRMPLLADENPWLANTPRPHPVEMPPVADINAAITHGVDFLLVRQNKNGSWGSARQTKQLNIYAPVPGAHLAFRAAVTGLALSALIESKDERPEVAAAIERGEVWLLANLPSVRRATPDAIYNVWTHAYGIRALLDLNDYDSDATPENRARRMQQVADQIELLKRYESVDGGWGYYDFRAQTQRPSSMPNSFTTSTMLIALREARDAGAEVPERIVQRGLECIRRQQKPDFTYYYAYRGPTGARPMRSINRPGGSLGRSQVCNLALRMWGDERITDEVITVWLDRLFARNLWLDIGRKRPVPHESYFLVAGYFFYYGHYYASHCIELLPPDERPRHKAQMARLLMRLQEKDGSWWDYPLYDYHQQYGTAMAIMSLVRCRPVAE